METTIYMNEETYELLNSAAKELDMPKSRLVKYALFQQSAKVLKVQNFYSPVSYQNPGQKWRKFHIIFSDEEYQLFVDMRNFFKQSLSLLVALAVEEYLQNLNSPEPVEELLDNSPADGYNFRREALQKGKKFTIWWGKAGP